MFSWMLMRDNNSDKKEAEKTCVMPIGSAKTLLLQGASRNIKDTNGAG